MPITLGNERSKRIARGFLGHDFTVTGAVWPRRLSSVAIRDRRGSGASRSRNVNAWTGQCMVWQTQASTSANAPSTAGAYVILGPALTEQVFLPVSTAGTYQGKDPTVGVETLKAAWVPGAEVLYIGKAGSAGGRGKGIRERLRLLSRFGAGEAVAHWGGRYIWQLAESGRLLVAWKAAADPQEAKTLKAELMGEFSDEYDARPFANRKRG